MKLNSRFVVFARTILVIFCVALASMAPQDALAQAASSQAASSEETLSEGLTVEKKGADQAYFTYQGEPLLSFGGLSDFIFYAAEDAYDYKRWADWAAQHGINHLRAYPPLSWKHVETFTRENGGAPGNVLFPYEETEPGSRQFDLTKFNEAYWQRFRRKLEYLASKGIVVHLLMWNGWQLWEREADWPGHFFNPESNVNGFTDHLGSDPSNRFAIYHSVADEQAGLVRAQKAWFEKLVETTAGLGNVYYDLVHEIGTNYRDWNKIKPWVEEMALAVRARWRALEPDRPVILGMDAGGLQGFEKVSAQAGEMPRPGSEVDWIFSRPYFDLLIYGKVHHTSNARAWRKKYDKPYVPQESWDDSGYKWSYRVPNQRVHIRKYLWKFMMARCQQMDLYMKPRTGSQAPESENPPGFPHNYDPSGWNKFEDDALVLRRFWEDLKDYANLWFDGRIEAGPGAHQHVLSSAREAVAYLSSATGETSVAFEAETLKLRGLSLEDGRYRAAILQPDRGEVGRHTIHVRDGTVLVELPAFTDDLAVHIYRSK